MSLQNRFRLLVAIFGISVVANVLVSVWCIHIYVGGAIDRLHAQLTAPPSTNPVTQRLKELVEDLEGRPKRKQRGTGYRARCQGIQQTIEELPIPEGDEGVHQRKRRLVELARELYSQSERYAGFVDQGRNEEAQQLLERSLKAQCIEPMRALLAQMVLQANEGATDASDNIYSGVAFVTTVLSLNALAAFLLTAIGVHLVRNWVLKPVAALETAAEQHASGNLKYRIQHIPKDELGKLSQAVNRMADSLLDIQERLIEQERMAAIGEVTSTVAHNIRNPLAGIRASAQSSMNDLPESSEVSGHQVSIVRTVDSLNRWLRELLQVNQPIELNCNPALVSELVTRVTEVLQASARRRGVSFQVAGASPDGVALIDAPRVEQAILTIVANAVEASPAGAEVRIEIDRSPGPEWIELRFIDQGEGIPPEILDRIASPYFSTKPGGIGIGLYLARRVVRAHDGTLEFENNSDQGTTVRLRLPTAPDSSQGA